MKIRPSFVSNSSSSNFIVMFPRVPKSAEDVREIMFGMAETHPYYERSYTTKEIAESVWKEIQNQKSCEKLPEFNDTVKACIETGGESDLIAEKFFSKYKEKDIYWDIIEQIDKIQRGDHSDIIEMNPNMIPYYFSFADEDGEYWGMMEHSDIFHNLVHERESRH